MLLALYRTATRLGGPLIALHLRHRAGRDKEAAARLGERFGRPGVDRPDGRLLWVHAASVGESLAALPLIDALLAGRPDLHVLVTTGTVTSARLMAARLPARTIHQFAPVDRAAAWRAFLDFWRPDLACLVESEIWPNLILEAERAALPLVVVNGRLSPRTFRRWRQAAASAARLFGAFELCLARSAADGERFRQLGAKDVRALGDLKQAASPLPADPQALAALQAAIGGRAVWLAASTHPGEEDQVAAAHQALSADFPTLLTVVVPRHPERGDALLADIAGRGLDVVQRSKGRLPGPASAVYLADTLGELGLFYRLAAVTFIGGSLVVHGGQNPLEAARLGCPVLFGPHTGNFEETTAHLERRGAARRVRDADDLVATLGALLGDPAALRRMAGAALAASADQGAVLERIILALGPLLERRLGPRAVADMLDASA